MEKEKIDERVSRNAIQAKKNSDAIRRGIG